MNGISGDTGNNYRVGARYTVRVSRVGDAKDYAKQWSILNDGYQSMTADTRQKANDYRRQKWAYDDARLNAPSAVQTSEQQHQDIYKPMRDEKIAVGKLADQFDLDSPARFFRSRIAQAYPCMGLQSLSNFFRVSRLGSPTISTCNSCKRST